MKFSKLDLYQSIETCNFKITKKILSSDFKMDAKTGEWAMYLALKNQNSVAAKMLGQKGAVIRKSGINKALSYNVKTA